MTENIFYIVNCELMQNSLVWLEEWLPDGLIKGNEYVSLNPLRIDRNLGSFRVNLFSGKWADFAIGVCGKDLISLYAYLNSLKQYESAKALRSMIERRCHR